MEKTKQDHINLLEETIAFYGEDPANRRAVNNENGMECLYFNPLNKTMCAVGRCMIDPSSHMNGSVSVVNTRLINDDRIGIDAVLKDEYKGFKLAMWTKLQQLHDESDNWAKKGLSPIGEGQKELILKWIERTFTTQSTQTCD